MSRNLKNLIIKTLLRFRVTSILKFNYNLFIRDKKSLNEIFTIDTYGNNIAKNPILYFESADKSGFFSLFLWSLNVSYYAMKKGFIPYIFYSKENSYFNDDHSKNTQIDNTFEFYFKQKKIENHFSSYQNVLKKYRNPNDYLKKMFQIKDHYESINNNQLIEKYYETFEQFFEIKSDIYDKINCDLKDLNLQKDYIAVHFRGTDFRYNLKNHPKFVSESEYFKFIDKLLIKYPYSKIFLATDDENALELFIKKYKDRVKYFNDVIRSNDTSASFYKINKRSFNGFLSGYEVLRDSIALSKAIELVCIPSNVSIAAMIFSRINSKTILKTNLLNQDINIYGPRLIDVDFNFRSISNKRKKNN